MVKKTCSCGRGNCCYVALSASSEMNSKLCGFLLHVNRNLNKVPNLFVLQCANSFQQFLVFFFKQPLWFFKTFDLSLAKYNISIYTQAKELCSVCVLTRLLIMTYTKSNTICLLYNVKIENCSQLRGNFFGFIYMHRY